MGAGVALTASACGSRTGLLGGDGAGAPSVQSCQTTDDCVVTNACIQVACIDTFCQDVGPVECPLLDPCTVGTCDPEEGACIYDPVTEDFDGDGFQGALPGTIAGQPGACGDDCDDTRALAFPGGTEVCDGVDNDCDGIVDNGSDYLATATIERDLRLVSTDAYEYSATTDLVFGAGSFMASYWGKSGAQRPYMTGLDPDGNVTLPEQLVSNINAQTFGADLAFSGAIFGAVFSDNRNTDYEVSFCRFDALGEKLGPDLQFTAAPGFSTHERLIYDQGRFVVVWDDAREAAYGGTVRVYSQMFDVDGNPIGENLPITESGVRAELPIIAATPARFGVVHTVLTATEEVAVQLRTYDKNFGDPTLVEVVPSGARAPTVIAIGSSFLVVWSLYVPNAEGILAPGPVIRGALYDERGGLLVPPKDLTRGATAAMSPTVLSLGDRALLVWADNFADQDYELYAQVIGLELQEIEPRTRLTGAQGESLNPVLAITDSGDVGVFFDDKRNGPRAVYFMTLGCDLPERCDCSMCAQGSCPSCCIVK